MESEAVKRERLRLKKESKKGKLNEWHAKKITLASEWIENETTQKSRRIIRGGVYMCELGENIGTEQGECRPVIVVSNDQINLSSGNVSIVPLTKNLKKKAIFKNGEIVTYLNEPRYHSHYFLFKNKYPFLDYDSAVLGEETKTVSKIRLKEHKGNIDIKDMEKIMIRIEWVFGLRKSLKK